MNNKETMAANIKRYMEQKGVTNQQLCDDLNLKYTTFMDWIKGVTYPRIGKIEAMANYFGVLKSDLIEDKTGFNLVTSKVSAPSSPFSLTDREKDLILAYRARPEMQSAVNTLLGIPNGPSISEDVSAVIEDAAAFKTEPIESR